MKKRKEGEGFDVLRKEGSEYIVVDSVVEHENRVIEGNDGKTHVGSVRIKKVRCGKKCSGCPHPIYAYVRYRDGKKVSEKYLGKVE